MKRMPVRPRTRRMPRRAFMSAALAGGAGWLIARQVPAVRAQTADSRLDIIPAEPIGTIAPELHGHFIEHLGGVIYDGVWVGETSGVPNVQGVRQALVEELRK